MPLLESMTAHAVLYSALGVIATRRRVIPETKDSTFEQMFRNMAYIESLHVLPDIQIDWTTFRWAQGQPGLSALVRSCNPRFGSSKSPP